MTESPVILAIIETDIDPQSVVSRAAWIARLTDSEIVLLLCDANANALSQSFILTSEAKEIASKIRRAQNEILDELAQPVRESGIKVRTEILEDLPISDAVVQRALEINPRLVIKGTKYHSNAKRAVFVDTDWQLIRSCPYALWLVKPHNFAKSPVIVAAVDPTHKDDKSASLDQRIIEHAMEIAKQSNGQVLFEPEKGAAGKAERTCQSKQYRCGVYAYRGRHCARRTAIFCPGAWRGPCRNGRDCALGPCKKNHRQYGRKSSRRLALRYPDRQARRLGRGRPAYSRMPSSPRKNA
jgi:nucleotide-binding universal stress UspA family protein